MNNFDAKKVKEELIDWLRDWFKENGNGCKAVIGISGGKDSTVTAALCVETLGKENVVGVLMPNGIQKDISDSIRVCEHLGIANVTINIEDAVKAEIKNTKESLKNLGIEELSEQTLINLPPRIRMTTLYAVSQTVNGRVINTCNLSEDWVGYSTRYGDSAGDVAPLANLTVEEVKEYCKERKNSVDADTFVDFYQSKGWLVGKNPMKDWKAAVRTWERNRQSSSNTTPSKPQERHEPTEAELLEFRRKRQQEIEERNSRGY